MNRNLKPTDPGKSVEFKSKHPSHFPPRGNLKHTAPKNLHETSAAGPSHARMRKPAPSPQSNMQILPEVSRVDDQSSSSELIKDDSHLMMKKLLPGRIKRRSNLLQTKIRPTRVDSAEEPNEQMVIKVESAESIQEPKELLAAIRTLPTCMKEKRDYRKKLLLQNAGLRHGELSRLNVAFHKGTTRFGAFFSELFQKADVWSTTFKIIEGRFGTGVVSYFVFLRWLLLMNIIIFLTMLVFVVVPQAVGDSLGKHVNITLFPQNDDFGGKAFVNLTSTSKYSSRSKRSLVEAKFLFDNSPESKLGIDLKSLDDLGSLLNTYTVENFIDSTLHYSKRNYTIEMRHKLADFCSHRYREYVGKSTTNEALASIQDFFQGTGWLQYTLLFMGFYEPYDVFFGSLIYNMPVAFLTVLFVVLFISIVIMMLYASKGVQESMLERNLKETYCYLIFCGWDYGIEEEKTAVRQQKSILQELISTIAEERTKAKMQKWTTHHKTKVFVIRSIMNIITLLFLVGSYYLFFFVAKFQLQAERTSTSDEGFRTLVVKFLPSITITILNFIFPMVLYILVRFEEYKMRHQINITLLRIIFLRQASLIILISSFYHEIICEPRDMCHKGEDTCQSPICWETYVGQQMYRLTILDLLVHICVVFLWETPRNYFVVNFKNRYTQLVGRQLFDIPTQVLGLVYSQTLCWLGMFYSPLIPAITVAKFIIYFYIKKFTVLRNCAPEQTPYKASRSNAIFVLVLMLSFFITLAVLGYSVAQITPSPGCSPYRLYDHMLNAIRDAIQTLSPEFSKVVTFAFSPLFVGPIIILLILALYYFITKASAHKKMVKLLKVQLTMEGKDKQFLLHRVTKIKPRTDTKNSPKQE